MEDEVAILDDPRFVNVQCGDPYFRISESPLPAEPFERLVQEGNSYAISPLGFTAAPAEREFLDMEIRENLTLKEYRSWEDFRNFGFRFGIEIEVSNASVRLTWWQDTPVEWEAFRKWVLRLQDFLERCMKFSGKIDDLPQA